MEERFRHQHVLLLPPVGSIADVADATYLFHKEYLLHPHRHICIAEKATFCVEIRRSDDELLNDCERYKIRRGGGKNKMTEVRKRNSF